MAGLARSAMDSRSNSVGVTDEGSTASTTGSAWKTGASLTAGVGSMVSGGVGASGVVVATSATGSSVFFCPQSLYPQTERFLEEETPPRIIGAAILLTPTLVPVVRGVRAPFSAVPNCLASPSFRPRVLEVYYTHVSGWAIDERLFAQHTD